MENQEAKTEAKKVEAKVETKVATDNSKTAGKKSGSGLKTILVLFVLAFIGAGAYWLYGKIEKYIPRELLGNQPTVTAPVQTSANTVAPAPASDDIEPVELPDVIVSLLPPLVADANEVPNPALSAELGNNTAAPQIQPEVVREIVKKDNRIFILYMAARDLRDSINTPERFQKELSFVRSVSLDHPELQSKIELLEIASTKGIPSREKLLADLTALQEKMRNKNHGSFVANVQSSLSRLIVISKIEGEVSSNDYNSIIKRAEIAIEKNDLTKAKLELTKLGADAAPVTESISNLANVRQITEYIVDFAKSKIASE